MSLGNFSVSLAVKDLERSIAFYKTVGFEEQGGGDNWRIMTNGTTAIGLFQGMFEQNMLTFNPGWNEKAEPLADFEDVRAIRKRLVDAGIELKADEAAGDDGPGHIICEDPDGNPVMFDQHV